MLVDDFGKVKLIDFGFSLKCKSKERLTSYCGTPPYMSPELASRSPYSGHTSDIWALGVALFLMLNGKFPFKAGN
jgi:serine/threonine protein kinase